MCIYIIYSYLCFWACLSLLLLLVCLQVYYGLCNLCVVNVIVLFALSPAYRRVIVVCFSTFNCWRHIHTYIHTNVIMKALTDYSITRLLLLNNFITLCSRLFFRCCWTLLNVFYFVLLFFYFALCLFAVVYYCRCWGSLII